MTLFKPKYWSDDFFSTPHRKRGYGYPQHFCCVLSECDKNHKECEYSSKDVFELVWICLDEEHQNEKAIEIEGATRVLTHSITTLEDTQIGLLFPTLLSKNTIPKIKFEITKVVTANEQRLVQGIELLITILYDSLTRNVLVPYAQSALLLLRSLMLSSKYKTPSSRATDSLVALCLVTFLRVSDHTGLNNTAANVLYPLLSKRHDLTKVPFGIHVVNRCFHINRLEGGPGGYHAFCNLCSIDSRLSLPEIWVKMTVAGVKWRTDHHLISLIKKAPINQLLADAAVCVSQLGGTDGSHAPRFDTSQVTESLHTFLNKTFQLQLQEAIPVIDTLYNCGDLTGTDGLAVLFLKWVAVLLKEKHNINILCSIGVHKVLTALLASMIPQTTKNIHIDPTCSAEEFGMTQFPCFQLLASCQKLPIIEKYILGMEAEPVEVPLECRHVISCFTSLLETMKKINTTPAIKHIAINLHSSGLPVLLMKVKAVHQLALLASVDPSLFSDFFASNTTPAKGIITLLETNPTGGDELIILKALCSDPRSKKLLPGELLL